MLLDRSQARQMHRLFGVPASLGSEFLAECGCCKMLPGLQRQPSRLDQCRLSPWRRKSSRKLRRQRPCLRALPHSSLHSSLLLFHLDPINGPAREPVYMLSQSAREHVVEPALKRACDLQHDFLLEPAYHMLSQLFEPSSHATDCCLLSESFAIAASFRSNTASWQ